MKQRIWELDAFRGICVLGMVVVHFVYDITELYSLVQWRIPQWFYFLQQWGGILFLLISGICATLGKHSVRRGLIVFACGMLCTAVTWGMFRLELAWRGIIIWFGVLHCLGICMILWALLKKLPTLLLAAISALLIILGFHFTTLSGSSDWLIPLGIVPVDFISSDYFPLLPNFGFFLAGSVLGRTLYRKQQTLLPGISAQAGAVRFLIGCGKLSLPIYLLHQPILSGLCMLISLLK